MKYTVLVEFDPDAKAYSVVVPALPGCTSEGATLEQALANAREAIEGHVACLREMGEPVPEDTAPQAIALQWDTAA